MGRGQWKVIVLTALPGIVIYLALWLITVIPFDYRGATSADIDFLWQSLGIGFLTTQPVQSLLVLHTQPPGLNALYAADLAVSPDSHLLLLLSFATAAVLTITMIADAIRRITGSTILAASSGVIYAVLPATVLYSLYAYNTTITAFFAMLAVWALTFVRSRTEWSVALSSLGMLGLVLTRSTFIWPVMVIWVAALMWLGSRRLHASPLAVAAAAGIPLLIALGVQAHYAVNFSIPFMSSWSGQNMAKALGVSGALTINDSAQQKLTVMPCEASVLAAWQSGQLNIWDPGGLLRQPGCEAVEPPALRDVPAWDEPLKANSAEMNYNEYRALTAAKVWSNLMNTVVASDPLQLVRMATSSPQGFTSSGIGLYLSPAEDYPFLDPAREHLPTASALLPLSRFFGWVTWLLVIAGWITAAVRRRSALRHMIPFWFASGLLVFHAAASTLLEYSENMRYRAELDPVLLMTAVIAAAALVGSFLPKREQQPVTLMSGD